MRRPLVSAVVMLSCASAAHAAPAVATSWLPTRTESSAERARLGRIAAGVARRLQASAAPPGTTDLSDAVARAKGLMISGAVDEAAIVLDQSIDRALGDLPALDVQGGRELITLQLRRASIALARGEVGRARMLIARTYRWDPALTLTPSEDTPPMRATLEQLRRELGPAPPLEQTDLGDACRAGVLLTGRKLAAGIELSRFDLCAPRARVSLDATDDDERAISALGQVPARPTVLAASGSWRRETVAMKVAGPLALGLGVALTAAGGYFAAHAASRSSAIEDGCTAAMPCASADVAAWADDYGRARTAAAILVPLGVAALVGGTVVTILGFRKRSAAF